MKLFKFSVTSAIFWLAALLLASCTDEPGVDNRDTDYGYIQFKLYKQASYNDFEAQSAESRASKPELDYLAEATKVKVTLLYGDQTIAQTLPLSATNDTTAEFGVQSDKLRLLAGSYKVISYALFNLADEQIYISAANETVIQVVAGGLTPHDLTVNVTPRGSIRFYVTKNLATDNKPNTQTRATVTRQYTFDEVKKMDITVRHEATNAITNFTGLKMNFKIHFDENNEQNGTPGYQTSSLTCDSLLSLPAGLYTIRNYKTSDKSLILEECKDLVGMNFTVEDNKTTDVNVKLTLYEADEYIKDGYALYEIWKALNGPTWSYYGQNYPRGSNWDFNKDTDLWCYQPGVQVHSTGRIAKIVLSDFGFSGHIPEQIGQLSELIEFYLGSHNDYNLLPNDPTSDPLMSVTDRSRNRMQNHKKFLEMTHWKTQFSEPIARALKEHNISIPEIALYEKYTEKQIIDEKSGKQLIIRPYDVVHGKLSNRLEYIDDAIGNLKKLEYLFIANSAITKMPSTMHQLESLTDFELYNCPKMVKFPLEITQMPALISVNIANNKHWAPDDLRDGLKALAEGPSKEKVQVFYCRGNNLKEIPRELRNMTGLGLIDFADNQIETIYPLGKEVSPVQVFLENNKLTHIPADEDGLLFKTDDIESISLSYNKLTKVPNIFTTKTPYVMKSVDLSYNDIDGFEGEDRIGEENGYRGLNVETLTLVGNKRITKYPLALAKSNSQVAYINLRGCNVDEIPEGSFKGKKSENMVSIDLSYNNLSKLPNEWSAQTLPYLYGVELSYNRFSEFPFHPLNSYGLTVYAVRGQRDELGNRILRQWPTGIYQHTGLRGFYIGSNNLQKIDDTISYLIYFLDISDNPEITFNAKDICSYWRAGMFNLIYDKTQNILNCDEMKK